ncbi:hypothetical protein UFOVP699_22 [uncultured Caudovirales phage]|uniref:Uncharacterized protein n=1 Tax=uncultured Caudovirales phage TaxID=2100421 RepID=A0A6J5NTX5_9CAUD|nr:hypothetical protein UFOVP699_22 [uncultured Caudovirales phage]
MEKYNVELTGKQLIVLQEALEFYSRFLLGQVDKIPMSLDFRLKNEHRSSYCNPTLDEAFWIIKREMFGLKHPNSSYGIGMRTFSSLEEDKEITEHQVAYEMYKMILYTWRQENIKKSLLENKDPGWTVHDEPPLKYTSEPLIKIIKTKYNEKEDNSL